MKNISKAGNKRRNNNGNVENWQTLEGYAFETVPAKGTSKRCSKCGRKGERKGKDFKCKNHEHLYRLDADLNAARNIAHAQPRAAAT
ncbi:MAG: zinc ribbon domain-containing protein [Promethearchaeia archaeon]